MLKKKKPLNIARSPIRRSGITMSRLYMRRFNVVIYSFITHNRAGIMERCYSNTNPLRASSVVCERRSSRVITKMGQPRTGDSKKIIELSGRNLYIIPAMKSAHLHYYFASKNIVLYTNSHLAGVWIVSTAQACSGGDGQTFFTLWRGGR